MENSKSDIYGELDLCEATMEKLCVKMSSIRDSGGILVRVDLAPMISAFNEIVRKVKDAGHAGEYTLSPGRKNNEE